jgi:hypothetical protein
VNSWYHAQSSARKWGGEPGLYLPIHSFIDSSKKHVGDMRHRAMYHHTEGTFLCEQIFGTTLTVPKKHGHGTTQVPVRLIAELHIIEDLGWLPSPADYFNGMLLKPWMNGEKKRTTMSLAEVLATGKETA